MNATTSANAAYHRHQYGLALIAVDRDAVEFHRAAWKFWGSFK
jgi:hypothetical protein